MHTLLKDILRTSSTISCVVLARSLSIRALDPHSVRARFACASSVPSLRDQLRRCDAMADSHVEDVDMEHVADGPDALQLGAPSVAEQPEGGTIAIGAGTPPRTHACTAHSQPTVVSHATPDAVRHGVASPASAAGTPTDPRAQFDREHQPSAPSRAPTAAAHQHGREDHRLPELEHAQATDYAGSVNGAGSGSMTMHQHCEQRFLVFFDGIPNPGEAGSFATQLSTRLLTYTGDSQHVDELMSVAAGSALNTLRVQHTHAIILGIILTHIELMKHFTEEKEQFPTELGQWAGIFKTVHWQKIHSGSQSLETRVRAHGQTRATRSKTHRCVIVSVFHQSWRGYVSSFRAEASPPTKCSIEERLSPSRCTLSSLIHQPMRSVVERARATLCPH
jgi:hypothetical protein